MTFTPLSLTLSLVLLFAMKIDAHGGLVSPRSRNQVAREQGSESSRQGVPAPEYCWQCLNRNNGVCGKAGSNDYDVWIDTTGKPMPWSSETTYQTGQVIQLELELTANHWGHFEFRACPKGRQTTQSCLDQYPLEFVEDVSYGMPKDTIYPERGYITGDKSKFVMKFRLPNNLSGSQVLLQWRYITANSCNPPGYKDYFNGSSNAEKKALYSPYVNVVSDCQLPFSNVGDGVPEQFWNCAEISVGGGSIPSLPVAPVPSPVRAPSPVSIPAPAPVKIPTPTLPAPTNSSPVRAPVPTPVATPVKAPVSSPVKPSASGTGCCSHDFKTCINWCGSTKSECLACRSDVKWLSSGSLQSAKCSARWGNCNQRGQKCCPGLVCKRQSIWYSQCTTP